MSEPEIILYLVIQDLWEAGDFIALFGSKELAEDELKRKQRGSDGIEEFRLIELSLDGHWAMKG